jgi:hypothetical protein
VGLSCATGVVGFAVVPLERLEDEDMRVGERGVSTRRTVLALVVEAATVNDILLVLWRPGVVLRCESGFEIKARP